MYYTKYIKITINNFLAYLHQFFSIGVYIPGLYSLGRKKKLTSHHL